MTHHKQAWRAHVTGKGWGTVEANYAVVVTRDITRDPRVNELSSRVEKESLGTVRYNGNKVQGVTGTTSALLLITDEFIV